MIRSHKIRMKVNNKQSTLLYKTCGCNRYAYNWMLNRANELKELGERFDRYKIQREFNAHKKNLPWMKEVNSHAVYSNANEKIAKAFQRMFNKQALYPKFHTKKKGVGTFSIDGSEMRYDYIGKRVYIMKMGWLKIAESVRFEYTKIHRITVSNKAGKWYVSFCLEIKDNRKCENQTASVGIDLGIKNTITCSDGTVIDNPRILKRYQTRLRHLQKQLARRKVGSKNREKTLIVLRNCYDKVACVRKDFIHKATTNITKKYGVVCMEDLSVENMAKNHKIAKQVRDAAIGEIRRQFEYKAMIVKFVDKFYPSSKTCSRCGFIKKDLKLSERTYCCSECGLEIDRDLNAAINIKNNAVGSTVSACGEFGAVRPSMKQELNTPLSNSKGGKF